MDTHKAWQFVDSTWDNSILPTLTDYLAIPNQSPAYDPDWQTNGYLDQAVELIAGESVRIMRELQHLSQNELSAATGIPQSTISAIERDRAKLGVERAKILARALRVHPARLVFPGWEVERDAKALLASAPLEGIDLSRRKDMGREVDF